MGFNEETTVSEATYTYDWKVSAIHKLRVNIKSLAAEARIIRQEARRAGNFYSWQLTNHRRGKLREEARYTHLALAYLRGRTYAEVEGEKRLERCKSSACPKRLAGKLSPYIPYGVTVDAKALNAWIFAG